MTDTQQQQQTQEEVIIKTKETTESTKIVNPLDEQKSASQEFLDTQQYAIKSVLKYERIFGKYFVSTGGKETTIEFTSKLNLKPGMKVLDVGCGIGGSAFYMAKNYKVNVHGIDLSKNMIQICKNNYKEQTFPENVTCSFEIADATKVDFGENKYDLIYSRDAILHIYDKLCLFKNFYKWLKPNGKVFITDYCCGTKPHQTKFVEYVKQRGYHLLTPINYGKVLESAGFKKVLAKDETNKFIEILKKEINKFKNKNIKKPFINDFSQEDYDHILKGWNDKIIRCGQGDQRWGAFYAEKIIN
jgi:phosphoethanolamine N-methyltransferase